MSLTIWSAQRSGGRPHGRRQDEGVVEARMAMSSVPVSRIEFTLKSSTGQSSDSERARDQWQCAAVTPQVNLSFSFVSCISIHVIECNAIESS